MAIFPFVGFRISAGVSPLYASTGALTTRATLDGKDCVLVSEGGIGAAIDPFNYSIECEDNCTIQSGDTVRVSSVTFLLVQGVRLSWSVCGGECRDSKTTFGIALGLEGRSALWRVR